MQMLERSENTAAPTPEQIEAAKKLRNRARPYSGRHKYDDDDDAVTPTSSEPPADGATGDESRVEDNNLSPEENTYKKRYGDLRSLHQKDRTDFQRETARLVSRIESLEKGSNVMPKSEAEIKSWMAEYPDLAATILHLADNKVKESMAELTDRLSRVEEDSLDVAREKAYLSLIKLHKDADEIKASPEFHAWVQAQEQEIQDWFYENDTNYRLAARGIDMFKAETGWGKKKTKQADTRRDNSREVPESVRQMAVEPNSNQHKRVWRESEIAKLKPHEWEKLEEEITEAHLEGRIVQDLKNTRA